MLDVSIVYSAIETILSKAVTKEITFLYRLRDKVERLHTKLRRLRSYLNGFDGIVEERDERLHKSLKEIKMMVYDAEDSINSFILTAASRKQLKINLNGKVSALKEVTALPNALKPQKKGTLGGKNAGTTRKPLQDLNNRNNYETVDIGSSKAANKSLVKNENVFKGEKVQKAKLARKPLGDLTNSKKPQLKDASTTKKNNLNGKVSALKEVTALPNDDWIAEEGFLHNHKECKAQEQTMSMESYLQLTGLRKEYTPTIAESQPPVMSPTAPLKEIPCKYESPSDVPSPSLSPTCSPPLGDWEIMELDLELMLSPPPP